MASDLFKRLIAPDESHDGISRRVWAGTPWVFDGYTGQGDHHERRYSEMCRWCRDRFGMEAFPFGDNPRPGRWRVGNATVFGWTWFGFSTEAEMNEFAAAWPRPAQPDVGSASLSGETK